VTSINAIRFDDWSGAMVCDEQRHWNDERLKLYAADKIRPVVPPELTRRYGLAAAYGNTGTSSIGDELRLTIGRRVEQVYRERCEATGGPPEFLSLRDVAGLAFEVITALKHSHTDDGLATRLGFTTADLCRGYYERDGRRIELSTPKVHEQAFNEVALDPEATKVGPIFGNAGIVAGVDRQSGFGMYLYSMRGHFWEPVNSPFVCQGSGSDTANVVLARYVARLPVRQRRGTLNRAEALLAMLCGVNAAFQNNLGVGGYYNILLFDGRATDPDGVLRQINDHRSKLAAEIALAHDSRLLPLGASRDLLEELLFGQATTQQISDRLWQEAAEPARLHRILRGYPAPAAS
jgi:hypothetical protein